MPAPRHLATALVCALTASAHAAIEELTDWDLYTDSASATPAQAAAMTGSSAPNLAQLNFIDDVDQDAGFDIGYSSINANTVSDATAGYYFSAASDFSVALNFELTLTGPEGFVGIGLGIGEDLAGENSAGIALGVGSSGTTSLALFGAAGRNNDSAVIKPLSNTLYQPVISSAGGSTTYAGSMTVSYDASTGDIAVGAGGVSGTSTPDPAQTSATFLAASDLPGWAGDDLLVTFFLRSDDPSIFDSWTGQAAEADFFDFTAVQGSPVQVPEPASLALLGLGTLVLTRRR